MGLLDEKDKKQLKTMWAVNKITDFEPNRELGDIEGLKKSIEKSGLFHPILIDKDGSLLAGRRRLKAIKELGWDRVPIRILDPKDELGRLRIEFDENTARKNYTDPEQAILVKKIDELMREEHGIAKAGGDRQSVKGKKHSVDSTEWSDEKTGKQLGITRTTVSKAKRIADIVENEPELKSLSGDAVLAMGSAPELKKLKKEIKKDLKDGKKLTARVIKKKVRKQITEELLKDADPIPDGEFEVIYADPPWRYDFSGTTIREIENKYPTMEVEDIEALEIPSADNAVLYLWATAPKLREALAVMESWGFEYKSNMVWDKEIIGMGYWSRGQHELLLIGTKGKFSPPEEDKRVSSVIRHRREKHSKKPEKVYILLEKMFPNRKYLELFARQTRKGWKVWGAESKDEEPDKELE